MADLGPIKAKRRDGSEPLLSTGRPIGGSVADFWAWSASDLLSNATRGILAEFIVAQALGVSGGVREEWTPWDLTTPSGVKVKVKSAAYIQSWHQRKLSAIAFNITKRLGWDAVTGRSEVVPARPAEVYVFALLAETDKSAINPLNLDQWKFYVLPTSVLDERARSQHSITLPSLRKLTDSIGFAELALAVESARPART